jgi:hypothetical protein
MNLPAKLKALSENGSWNCEMATLSDFTPRELETLQSKALAERRPWSHRMASLGQPKTMTKGDKSSSLPCLHHRVTVR